MQKTSRSLGRDDKLLHSWPDVSASTLMRSMPCTYFNEQRSCRVTSVVMTGFQNHLPHSGSSCRFAVVAVTGTPLCHVPMSLWRCTECRYLVMCPPSHEEVWPGHPCPHSLTRPDAWVCQFPGQH